MISFFFLPPPSLSTLRPSHPTTVSFPTSPCAPAGPATAPAAAAVASRAPPRLMQPASPSSPPARLLRGSPAPQPPTMETPTTAAAGGGRRLGGGPAGKRRRCLLPTHCREALRHTATAPATHSASPQQGDSLPTQLGQPPHSAASAAAVGAPRQPLLMRPSPPPPPPPPITRAEAAPPHSPPLARARPCPQRLLLRSPPRGTPAPPLHTDIHDHGAVVVMHIIAPGCRAAWGWVVALGLSESRCGSRGPPGSFKLPGKCPYPYRLRKPSPARPSEY